MRVNHHLIAQGLLIVLVHFAVSLAAATPQLSSESLDQLGLLRGEIISLELEISPRLNIETEISIDGQEYQLDMRPHNVRSKDFVVRAQQDDGSFVVTPTESRTVRGYVVGDSNSRVVGSALENGLAARITMGDGRQFYIEPLANRIKEAQVGQHIVYSSADVKPHDKNCGVEDNLVNAEDDFEASDFLSNNADVAFGGGGSLSVAEIALDADFEYFQDYGSSVQATTDRMELIINLVNDQYETQTAVTHMITDVIVRSSSNDPYTSSDAETLLNQFRSEWLTNQGGVNRDVAHLFTGKSIIGGTIGIAFVRVICNTNAHYGLSESDFNNNLACANDLTTHELGHNWNCNHCNCPSNTMNPSITCANNFATVSINSVIAHRDSVGCLSTGGTVPMPPPNDDWANTINLGNTFPIGTTGTNVDATTEPGEQELTNVDATVWWFFTAPDDGNVTIDTFGSDFDTLIHIYDGFFAGATVADLNPIANNDDAGGVLQSEITFPVTANTCYEIRIGGFQGDSGNINLTGTFTIDEEVLLGDTNCDGVVNLLDINSFVNAISSGVFNEKADINQDGNVNVLDIGPFINLISG